MISELPPIEIVDQALWRLHFAEDSMCVAESEAATYLVLFTSPERAEAFVQHRFSARNGPATATLHSETQAEFMAEAGEAAAQGLDGAVIDPESDGQVLAIIDFCRDDCDIPLPGANGD